MEMMVVDICFPIFVLPFGGSACQYLTGFET
jgi:hypothetical protein